MNKNDILSQIILSDTQGEDSGFFPLLSAEDEEKIQSEEIPEELPILPLRNSVLFPGVIIPITIGRASSLELINDVYKKDRIIGVVAQKDPSIENPKPEDLFQIGTVAYIIKMLKMPDESNTIIIQGRNRFSIDNMTQNDPFYKAKVSPIEIPNIHNKKEEHNFPILIDTLKELALKTVKGSSNIPPEASFALQNIESPLFLIHYIASNLKISAKEKQKLLEMSDMVKLAKRVHEYLNAEIRFLEIKEQIQEKVKTDMDKQQRDYFLNMQLKTIQEELGGDPHEQEIKEIEEKASKQKWNEKTEAIFRKELGKLKRMNPSAAEFSIQMNYVEFLTELPWNEYSVDNFDLKHAKKVLNEDHFGLEKVKERIIEFLAVLKLKGDMKSPILCLLGPPGVGKTSLGKSIARALDRKYIRLSLGGLRDESELRGHRKTYIGAMPGRIIQNLKKAETSNPVFVLDEIDKVSGNNFQGDPQAALLEILDPEQNSTFYDNYLEMDFDLSKILFIATANDISTVNPALRDRMEIIDLSGYTLEEKTEIAHRHLIPKQIEENGMKKAGLKFSEAVIKKIISNYTRESGVRGLERNIAKVIRHYAVDFSNGNKPGTIKVSDLEKILGVAQFSREKSRRHSEIGIVTGLAWTSFGGEILFIEASLSKGNGTLTMTGNLGDVMKESANLAFQYIKSHNESLNIDQEKLEKYNLHIHVPEGATPKDGPSAGITIFTALCSIFTGKAVKSNIAMTGEITLRGDILPVGGIKEKILAAKRSGIDEIVVCENNTKDILEIEDKYRKDIKFHYIKEMKDVLAIALED